MGSVQPLPYVDIQHDALAVFDDVEQGIVVREDIWVSAYQLGSPSVHGKVRVEARDGGGLDIAARDGIKFERQSKTNFVISAPSLGISMPIRFPRQVVSPPFTKPTPVSQELHINSIAYSDKAEELVIGGPDGYAVVLSPSDPSSALELKGHVGDVLHVRWFPSGQVVLTASSDLTLRIFSSKTGINPRTLKGHTRAITSTQIVDIGKQVLSGSKDGTVRLWDVGAGTEAKKWTVGVGKFVDGLVLVDDASGLRALGAAQDDKVIFAATAEGPIYAFSLSSDSGASPLFTVPAPTASKLLSVAHSPSTNILATGHADGTISLRTLSSLVAGDGAAPAKLIKRNEAPIYSLMFVDREGEETGLLVGTGSGLPCRLNVSVQDQAIAVTVREEYAGWEAVGIEGWAVGADGVWCAGGDRSIRRY